MRNLKKVLSMALAVVMMLGMMTFATAADEAKTETKKAITAADLTDMDKVVNKEAVSLLVDLGVIVGTDKLTFDPTGDVTRGQMAKLIYVAKMGSDDGAKNFVGAATDLKDITGHWAEGYINYCYSTGIVAGRGEGKFDPDAKVTAVEASKMILVALGYDSDAQGYSDPKIWSVTVMQDAKKSGLLGDVKEGASTALVRDSAAQMIFNGLFANTITNERQKDFEGNWYVSKVVQNATTLGEEIFGLVKISGVVDSVTDGAAGFKAVTPADAALLAGINKAKVPVAGDMIGKKVVIYAKATKDKDGDYTFDKAYSSVATAGKSVVLGTSTNGTAITGYTNGVAEPKKDLTTKKTANKGFIVALNTVEEGDDKGDYLGTQFLNGTTPETIVDADSNGIDDTIEATAKIVGAVVELIDANGDGLADTIKVTKKTVTTLTADPTTKTVDDVLQVKVPGVVGLNTFVDAKKVIGYDDLKKDDVVLYFKGANDVYTIEKAESIEGKVTATKGNPVTNIMIDGTYYGASGLNGFDITTVDTENTYNFYFDNGKNLVKASQLTSESAKEYAVILQTAYVAGSGIGSSNYGQAKLLFADGSTEVVTVAKLGDDKINTATNGDKLIALNPDADTNYSFVTYTPNDDDSYNLKIAESVALGTGEVKITNGSTGVGGATGNSDTRFIVAIKDGDSTVYKTYAGIDEVPTMKVANAQYNTAVIVDKFATYVFVNTVATAVEGIAGDTVYFTVPDVTDRAFIAKAGTVPSHYVMPIYVDGVLDDKAAFSADAIAMLDGIALKDEMLYSVSTTNDSGHYTAIADATVSNMYTGIKLASGGTLSLEDGTTAKTFRYDSDSVVYLINKDGEMSQIAMSDIGVDVNDIVRVFATSKLVDVLYVWEVNVGDAGMSTTAKITVDGTPLDNVTLSFTENNADKDGSTAAKAKTATMTVASVAAAKSLKLEFAAAHAEASIALAAGIVPTKTAAASGVLSNVLTYVVTAEDGTPCYYAITLAITSAAA